MKILLILALSLICYSALGKDRPAQVSLISLIANPEKYNGEYVQVDGFLRVRFENSALYLTKDHADRYLGMFGIWADYKEGAHFYEKDKEVDIGYFDGKWVLLEGIFNYTPDENGHLSAFAGELIEIDRIIEHKTLKLTEKLKDPR